MQVVVATDGSPHAMRAAHWVARWGSGLGDIRVTLVNVGHIPTAPGLGPGGQRPTAFAILAEEMEQIGTAVLAKAAEAFPGKVTSVYRAGDPAEEILKVAHDVHADLIVVGRRGLGRLGEMFLGSVSERVLRGAECTVLVVR